MKIIICITLVILLNGCSLLGYKKFPQVPPELLTSCETLKTVEPTQNLSDVLSVVVENYGRYHECDLRVKMWIEWYTTQKEIYNE